MNNEELLTNMTEEETRMADGGSFHCNKCGWATWGLEGMLNHIKFEHNGNAGYHFHWRGNFGCYTNC